jgi:hypothetical protein
MAASGIATSVVAIHLTVSYHLHMWYGEKHAREARLGPAC